MTDPHPYVAALLGSGVNLLSLESFADQTQRNRSRRAALKRRMFALTASVIQPPDQPEDEEDSGPENYEDGINEAEKALGLALQAAMSQFVEGGDTSAEAWQTLLYDVLAEPLHNQLEQTSKDWMLVRDLPLASEDDIRAAIEETVTGADDIRIRLLDAAATEPEPEAEAVVAGLSLPGFLSLKRVVQTVRGLTQRAHDLVEQRVVAKAVERDATRKIGFTGRRMWVSPSGTEGRYGLLHGTVVGPGQNFSVPARTVRGRELPAQPSIPFPRWDPTMVDSWSNNRDVLKYEFVGGDSVAVWR